MTALCLGNSLPQAKQPQLLHQSLPSITNVFSGLEVPVRPDVSPGGSSVSSDPMDRATPLIEDGFEYCDECKDNLSNVDVYASHVMLYHLKPRRLPSAQYFETIDKSDDLQKRPYTTLYPSKKRKPDSDRIPRPQNQYMIFSNYIRTPLMKYFGDINHAQISQAISTVWKRLTDSEKQAFKDESKQCELLHKIEYPHYKYKPKQKKAKKPDTTVKEQMSPQTSEEMSPVETKYFDSAPINSLYVNVSEPSVQPPTSCAFLGSEKFSHNPYGQYSPVGDSNVFNQVVSDAPSFQPYSSPQTTIMTNLGDGNVLQGPKSVPMFVKRDPVLSQNSAPQLPNDVSITLSSSWTPGMTVTDQFHPADNTSHFIVLQNGVPGALNHHLLSTDVPTPHDLNLPCSAPTDLTPSITDSHLLNELKMVGYNTMANNQPMDIDHSRDLNAFDAASLPNYDIDDKKDILDHRDGFEDYLQQYDEPMYLNPCAM